MTSCATRGPGSNLPHPPGRRRVIGDIEADADPATPVQNLLRRIDSLPPWSSSRPTASGSSSSHRRVVRAGQRRHDVRQGAGTIGPGAAGVRRGRAVHGVYRRAQLGPRSRPARPRVHCQTGYARLPRHDERGRRRPRHQNGRAPTVRRRCGRSDPDDPRDDRADGVRAQLRHLRDKRDRPLCRRDGRLAQARLARSALQTLPLGRAVSALHDRRAGTSAAGSPPSSTRSSPPASPSVPVTAVEDLLGRMLHTAHERTGARLDVDNVRDQILTFLTAGHETTSGRSPSPCGSSPTIRPCWRGRRRRPTRSSVRIPRPARRSRRCRSSAICGGSSMRRCGCGRRHRGSPGRPAGDDGGWLRDAAAGLGHRLPSGVHLGPGRLGPTPTASTPTTSSPSGCGAPAYSYLPFGVGMRACIGRQFAIHEAVLVLARLLRRFDLRADSAHDLMVTERLTLMPRASCVGALAGVTTSPKQGTRRAQG